MGKKKKKKTIMSGSDDNTAAEKETKQQLPLYSLSDRRMLVWQSLLIIFLSIVVYANSLSGNFVWDDADQIVGNSSIKTLSNIPYFFTTSIAAAENKVSTYYRPLFNTSLSLDYVVWKLRPYGYHVTNVLLHALASLLVFLTGLRLLKNRTGSLIAAVLFAVHPVHAEAVAWVSARGHLLAAIFIILSLYFYIKFRDEGGKRYLFFSIAAFSLSMLSIETAVTLPGIILLYEILLNKKTVRLRYMGLYAVFLALYFIVRSTVLSEFTFDVNTLPLYSRLLTAPVIAVRYLFAFIFPFGLKVGYDLKPADSILLPLLSCALLGVILFAAISLKKNRVVLFGILWFAITILPVLSIVKQVHPLLMSPRYLYIPSIGLSLSAAMILGNIPVKLPAGYKKFSMAAFVLLLSIITFHENAKWESDLILFTHMVADNPESSPAHFYLGNSLKEDNRYDEAVSEYEKSLHLKKDSQIFPALYDLYGNLAIVYDKKGLLEKAISTAKVALEYKPDSFEIHYNLGIFYRKQGLFRKAFAEYVEAIKLNPDYPEAHYNLGNLFIKEDNLTDAIREYSIAVNLKSDYDIARFNLSLAYFISGDRESARKEYEILKTINAGLADKLLRVFSGESTAGK